MSFTATSLLLLLNYSNNIYDFKNLKDLSTVSQIVINNYLNANQISNSKFGYSKIKSKRKAAQPLVVSNQPGIAKLSLRQNSSRPTLEKKIRFQDEKELSKTLQEISYETNDLQPSVNSTFERIEVLSKEINQITDVSKDKNFPLTQIESVNSTTTQIDKQLNKENSYENASNISVKLNENVVRFNENINNNKISTVKLYQDYRNNFTTVLQELLITRSTIVTEEEHSKTYITTNSQNDEINSVPCDSSIGSLIPVPPSSAPPLSIEKTKDPLLALKDKINSKKDNNKYKLVVTSGNVSSKDMHDELALKLKKRASTLTPEQKALVENEQQEREARIKACLIQAQKKRDEENEKRAQAKKTPKILSEKARRIQALMSKKNLGNSKGFEFSDILINRTTLIKPTPVNIIEPVNNTVKVKTSEDINVDVVKSINALMTKGGTKLKKVNVDQLNKPIKTLEMLKAELAFEQNKKKGKNLFNIMGLLSEIRSLEESASKFKREGTSQQAAAQHNVRRTTLTDDRQIKQNKVTAILKKSINDKNKNYVKDINLIDTIASSTKKFDVIKLLEIKNERIRQEGNLNALANPEEKKLDVNLTVLTPISKIDNVTSQILPNKNIPEINKVLIPEVITPKDSTFGNVNMLSVFGSKINLSKTSHDPLKTVHSADDIINALVNSNIKFSAQQLDIIKKQPIENLRCIESNYYDIDSGWDFQFVTEANDIMYMFPKVINLKIPLSTEKNEEQSSIENISKPKVSLKSLIQILNSQSNGISTDKDDNKSGLLAQICKLNILNSSLAEEENVTKPTETKTAVTVNVPEQIIETIYTPSLTLNDDKNIVAAVPFGALPVSTSLPPIPVLDKNKDTVPVMGLKNQDKNEDEDKVAGKDNKEVIRVCDYRNDHFLSSLKKRRAVIHDEDKESDDSDW